MSDSSRELDTPYIARIRATRELLKEGGESVRLLEIDAATFHPMVGEAFDTSREEGPSLPLVLQRVSERTLPCELPGRKPFSLLFAGPHDSILPQGTYRFFHAALGHLDLFIVPLGPGRDRRSMTYQAVFG